MDLGQAEILLNDTGRHASGLSVFFGLMVEKKSISTDESDDGEYR
jgi:hypothetical protein